MNSSLANFLNLLGPQDADIVRRDMKLSSISRWRIGGAADLYIEPQDTASVSRVMRAHAESGVPLFVMGDGTNMLFDSKGFRGVVMRIGRQLGGFRALGDGRVLCGGGAWVPEVALRLARLGLTGLEHVVGIPGTLGGLVVMNGGSQQKGIGSRVTRVTIVEKAGGIGHLTRPELGFSYRQSSLQGRGSVVTEVELQLDVGTQSAVRREMIDILRSRKAKFPKNLPNCGSTFLSNPEMYQTIGPPGRVIEQLDLKGVSIGGAQVSPLHANFLVNNGTATSDDVLALIYLIRDRVRRGSGYEMDCEVRYLSPQGVEAPAHEIADRHEFDCSLLKGAIFPDA